MQGTRQGQGGRLAGEVAIVTGSTSGLGRATARLFADEGGQVVVTGRNEERGKAIVDDIVAAGGDATFIAADLGEEDACQALVASTVAHYGKLTVLVNNAVAPEAIAKDTDVVSLERSTVERMLEVNLVGPWEMCKFSIPEMVKAGHGSIVNISATSGGIGTPAHAAYTASKGGITALTRAIVADYGRKGVRCNTVQSGYIIHERRHAGISAERVRWLEGRQITRLAEQVDIAYAILFLACRESDVITGVCLPVDGGAVAVRGNDLGD